MHSPGARSATDVGLAETLELAFNQLRDDAEPIQPNELMTSTDADPPEERSPFGDALDREIARMVVEGASNKAIARATGLAIGTVKWRLHRMYRSLDVHSRITFAMTVRKLFDSS